MELSRIRIYPIKSLDGVDVSEAAITAGGSLENDRVYAMFDGEGRIVNGKRTADVHRLRCAFDERMREVTLRSEGSSTSTRFALDDPRPLERWFGDYFGFSIELRHEPAQGFPDDAVASGPTLVGVESLREVQRWYEGLELENVRRRFRTNLELDGGEGFREDALFGGPGELKPFRIGSVRFLGHNPCQRCVVPSRDPDSGEAIRGFQKLFARRREDRLQQWSDVRRFDHFYRFAVNSSIPPSEAGKRLRIGDSVTIDPPA